MGLMGIPDLRGWGGLCDGVRRGEWRVGFVEGLLTEVSRG